MTAYTLKLTNAAGDYTFDVQPSFEPSIIAVHDESKSPALLTATVETWSLTDAVYRSATASSVTTDFATLATLLGNRAQPLTSVKFIRDSTTVREMNTTTHAQLMFKAITPKSEPGAWLNHWRGDLVIVGKALKAGSGDLANIVRLETKIRYSYDPRGLLTQTFTGKIETEPGTSAKTKAQAQAPDSLGSAYVYDTGGDNNIEVTVENDPDDTLATFTQVQREIGTAIPSTATDWALAVETRETAAGKETTYSVRGGGTSNANALTAIRSAKPSAALVSKIESQQKDAQGATATYVTREPRPATAARYGRPRITAMRRAFDFRGGGKPFLEDPIPGSRPFVSLGAWRWLVVTESVTVSAVNVTNERDIPLPAILWPDNLQSTESSDTAPELDGDEAEQRSADRYVRRATRVYVFAGDPPDFSAVAAVVFNAPGWADEPDYKVRMRVEG